MVGHPSGFAELSISNSEARQRMVVLEKGQKLEVKIPRGKSTFSMSCTKQQAWLGQ